MLESLWMLGIVVMVGIWFILIIFYNIINAVVGLGFILKEF